MSSDFRQSTMKSEPARPVVRGVPSAATARVSAAMGEVAGTLRAASPAALAVEGNAMAAGATATPARNWRRSILGVLDIGAVPSRFSFEMWTDYAMRLLFAGEVREPSAAPPLLSLRAGALRFFHAYHSKGFAM